jgi:hypothetical protein
MVGRESKVGTSDQRAGIGMKKYAVLALILVSLSVAFFVFESEINAQLLPHLPYDRRKSVYFYTDLFRLVSFELLWYAGFIVLFILIVAYIPLSRLTDGISKLSSRASAFVIIALGFMMILVIGHYVLDRFPNSGDEYVYLYQAKTMADGKLWERGHDLPEFFHFNHIAQKDGISVGRFPPGWPAFLTLAFYFGFPAFFVDPILALIAMVIFYFFARRQYSDKVASWGLVAFVFTSYFLYFSASYFSHISCMVAVLAFVACLYRYMDTRAVHYALAAGFFLGLAATIRYFTAFLIFLPFIPMLLTKYRLKSIPVFFWIGLGALPCFIFLLWFNYCITGNALLPVTVWAYPEEGLGFVKGHTPLHGLEHLVRRAAMFLYWCSPALLILYVFYLIRKVMKRSERLEHVEDYAFALLTVGYFFYYEIGGDQYGPRFLLEALPFLALFVTRKVLELPSHRTMALFIAGCIYAVVKMPVISPREHRVIKERTDLYTQVEERKLKDAVVLISTFLGDIRPMPVGDLTRNAPPFQSDVLFVFDIPEHNKELFDYYPQRDFYRYEWLEGQGRGRLVKLDTRSLNAGLRH